jgi:hypothetical protein
MSFGLALTLIFQWFTSVMNSSQLVAKPALGKIRGYGSRGSPHQLIQLFMA